MLNKDFRIDTPILKRKIGLSSIYFRLNQQHDLTFMGEDDGDFKPAVRECLDELWGVPPKGNTQRLFSIKEYTPMLELLNWFKTTGHRFDERFYDSWYQKSILAWDVARYSDMVRKGYYLNYIGKKTALEHLDYAHEMSKDNFESWEDYGRNFLFFKKIWDNHKLMEISNNLQIQPDKNYNLKTLKELQQELYEEKGISNKTELEQVIEDLLSDKEAIWNQVSWNF